MSRSRDPVPREELLRALLHEAGVRDEPERLSLLGSSTSNVWAVTAGGQRYLLRERLDGDAQMARKEAYLGELLRRYGVPAAVTLAGVADERGVATLNTLLPGIRLDQAMRTLSASDLRQAWRSTGEALVHSQASWWGMR